MASLSYYPRLDGLRAIAIGGVFVEHFTYNEAIRDLKLGAIGVRLFFVLSGYLITSILLKMRRDALGPGPAAAQFYSRRLLRLSPPFYLAIAIAAAIGIADMRQDWWIHGLYLSNFQIAATEQWSGAGHFWTLAVEEQFYLLWFAVVVLAPRRWLMPIVLACLVVAPVFRGLLPRDSVLYLAVLLPGQIDSLATGALLACAAGSSRLAPVDRAFASNAALLVSTLAVALLALPLGWPAFVSWVVFPIVLNAAAACAVRSAVAAGASDSSWLSARPVRHVGRISYGLYVYHYFIPPATYALFPEAGEFDSGAEKLLRTLAWLIATFAIAELSWAFVERPALRLKDKIGAPRLRKPPLQGAETSP